MRSKVADPRACIARIQDGATVMMGGFGVCGIPENMVRLLVEQIERTATMEGRNRAMQQIADMLRSLDEPVLRGLVYRQGLADEDEMTEPEYAVVVEGRLMYAAGR